MAEVKAVVEQKEWLKKSTLKFFEKNKDTMMPRRVIDLGHPLAVKALSSTFEPLSRDAHYITNLARGYLADRVSSKIYQEDEIFRAETTINSAIVQAHDFFDKRIAQAYQKLELAGEAPDQALAHTRGYAAKCSTRTAKEYLDLVKKADVYLLLNQYLEIIGELSDIPSEALRARLNNEREIRNRLFGVTRTTQAQCTVIHRICSAVIEQRKQEREQQSQRDKELARQAKIAQLDATQSEMDKLAGEPKKRVRTKKGKDKNEGTLPETPQADIAPTLEDEDYVPMSPDMDMHEQHMLNA